jgi:hypothetical protein
LAFFGPSNGRTTARLLCASTVLAAVTVQAKAESAIAQPI